MTRFSYLLIISISGNNVTCCTAYFITSLSRSLPQPPVFLPTASYLMNSLFCNIRVLVIIADYGLAREIDMKTMMLFLFCLSLFYTQISRADAVSLGADDDLESVLAAHTGKYVTVVLESGKEFTGKVGSVYEDAMHLMELSGKEFYDAVIDTDEVAAVVIRVRNN